MENVLKLMSLNDMLAIASLLPDFLELKHNSISQKMLFFSETLNINGLTNFFSKNWNQDQHCVERDNLQLKNNLKSYFT